jgi:predicted transcriptional regulator of viral defense system
MFIVPFTVGDVEEKWPDVARPTINSLLRAMKDEGLIERVGAGRNTKWRVK